MRSRPDVLVLGAGGVLGEAWLMGTLAGIEDGTELDMRECEYFLGTSAGAIVAANLAAGKRPRRPRSVEPAAEQSAEAAVSSLASAARAAARSAARMALTAGSPVASLALGLAAPGGALARAAVLRGLPRTGQTLDYLGAEVAQWAARFDGRLRIAAVEVRSGRRVLFGAPGAPAATVAEAVTASCTIPWLFAPVEIGGRRYVDGGVWSPTNLDVAPAGRGTDVLCLNPTASIIASGRALAFVRTLSRSAASVESLALRGRGASVRVISPNVDSATAMGGNLMDRAPRQRVLAAGYRQGLALGTRPATAP